MKSMKFSSLIRVLAVATLMSGAALASAPTDPARTTDDGGGVRAPGSPITAPGNPNAIPEYPDERGWRQTPEEFEKVKTEGAKKKTKDQVEGEDWRDAMREGEKDRKGRKLTAQDTGKSAGDREIARQTRRAVVADDTLSTAAHNVKIISRNGKVTLKGRVDSEVEKNNIVEKAAAIVGAENVVNKLTVKTPKSK